MKLRQTIAPKQKLSATLRNWLPLLQCPINELETKLKEYASINPYVEIESNQEIEFIEEDFDKTGDDDIRFGVEDFYHYQRYEEKNSKTEVIEAMSFDKKTLYEKLSEQITDTLFPTPLSKQIAHKIISNINKDGFFEGDTKKIANDLGVDEIQIEKIRQRFAYLEPYGIGAKDIKESFLFQLNEFGEIENDIYKLLIKMIDNYENLNRFKKSKHFKEAHKIFKKFKNPPAVEYIGESAQIIPDIYILERDGNLEVSLNESFYPNILIENVSFIKDEPFVKEKLKEAKDLIDAMNMRKATLYKIGLMIVEFQYDFFKGKDIKPMKLSDISEELGRNTSTISRAISNKYLACDRGIYPIKSFFSALVDKDTSAKAIKDFVVELIKKEDRKKPLSDQKIVDIAKEHFKINMVRRTITKYREQLNIPTSGERKRGYLANE